MCSQVGQRVPPACRVDNLKSRKQEWANGLLTTGLFEKAETLKR